MARSRTTFQRGNTAGFKRGNRVAMRHGMNTLAVIQERLPEMRARFEALAAANGYARPEDSPAYERWVELSTQARIGFDYFNAHGGFWTSRGNIKKGVLGLMQVCDRLEKLEKNLAIGPLARADVAQKMAGASLGAVEIRAALERLRRPKLTVLPGN